ncbi:MAG: hypothetical protein WBB28_13855 [Crinalium sp.]
MKTTMQSSGCLDSDIVINVECDSMSHKWSGFPQQETLASVQVSTRPKERSW